MSFRVLLVGGGSGGHVYPLVAVARALQKQRPDVQLLLLGDGPYVSRAAKEAGIRSASIMAPKLRRYASAGNFLDIFKIPVAIVQSLWHLFWFMPDVVLAKGGYTSAFPTLAARLFFIPVYLHESDSVPGLANRALAKRSKLVFTAFASADAFFAQLGRPTLQVGNPIRAGLSGVDHAAALAALQLPADKKTLLIIGGSQGAKQLNDLVLNALVQLVQKGYNVIHQTGDANFKDVKTAVEQYMTEGKDTYAPLIAAQYRVYAFFDQASLATAYGAADAVITRASASVLTEVASLGKPMIIVPLAGSANDHQDANAAELAQFGGVVVDGANLSPHLVMQQLDRILEPTTYADISTRIRAFAHPDAADKIATQLLNG